MSYVTFTMERLGSISPVSFNRPAKLNPINKQVMREFLAITYELQEDEGTRVVVPTGKGRSFSVGADMEMLSAGEKAETRPTDTARLRLAKLGWRVMDEWERLDQIGIAAVNGFAVGSCVLLGDSVRLSHRSQRGPAVAARGAPRHAVHVGLDSAHDQSGRHDESQGTRDDVRRGARVRLDLPDAGILTIEEGRLGDLPDDWELAMAFGFPNGESSIRAEEDSRIPHDLCRPSGDMLPERGRGEDFSIPGTDSPGRAALLAPHPGVGVTSGCTRSGTRGGGSMRPKFPG